ncbi:hypothetical protein NGRA_3197 [Nosema granulosis]|uniref:Uncharacterized protein n=1 Tax=Nosema granulosis TaxID=83296 RepID=A0A9P6GVQ2_9MICR|nr:hypothetical protein NGRA_3197 [Nosema granulosis]
MNNIIKNVLLGLLGLQACIVVLEILFCLFSLLMNKKGNVFLTEYILENEKQNVIMEVILRQMIRCCFLLLRIFSGVFMIIFVDSIDLIEDDINPSISFGEERIYLISPNTTVRKPYLQCFLRTLSLEILSFLDSEENVLLFLAYFYFYSTYTDFLLNPLAIPLMLILPYIYRKTNIKLYMKYRLLKPLVFINYSLALFYGLKAALFLNKKLEYHNLQQHLHILFEFFDKNGFIRTFCTKENSKCLGIEILTISKIAYVHLIGDIEALPDNELLGLLYKQIGLNHKIIEKLLLWLIFIFLEILIEISALKMVKELIVKRYSRIGRFFIVYLLLQISIIPYLTCVKNIFLHNFEYKSDEYAYKMTNVYDLKTVYCKQFFLNEDWMSISLPFNLFYDSKPSINRKLDQIIQSSIK